MYVLTNRLWTFVLLFCLSIGFALPGASAVEYQFYRALDSQELGGKCRTWGNGQMGVIKRIRTSFDDSIGVFEWEATFSPCNYNDAGTLRLPTGFNLAVNFGPNPNASRAGNLAFILFDATHLYTDWMTPNPTPEYDTPILSAYKYNWQSGWSGQYKQTAIVSNHPSYVPQNEMHRPENWIIDLSVEDSEEPRLDGNGNEAVRTFRMVLFAHHVLNGNPLDQEGNPLGPDDNDADAFYKVNDFRADGSWYGVGFNQLIGFWFHHWGNMFDGAVTYCDENCIDENCDSSRYGFIKSIRPYQIGYTDTANLIANKKPKCRSVVSSNGTVGENPYDESFCYQAEIGELFSAIATGFDIEQTRIQPYALTPSHSGVPADGFVYVPQGEQIVAIPADNESLSFAPPVDVNVEWIPQLSDGGSRHDIEVFFSDAGFNGQNDKWDTRAVGSCTIPVCVPKNEKPSCNVSVVEEGPIACEGDVTTVALSAAGSADPEGSEIILDWTIECKDELGNDIAAELVYSDDSKISAEARVSYSTEPNAATNCNVELLVLDDYEQDASCSTEFSIDPCPTDCADTPNGDKVVDVCGVCDGDGTSCLDCAGVPNGGAIEDLCGVCDGNNACLDCAGTPNGSAEIDECGVCDGDGSSCLDCVVENITEDLFLLDSNALDQKLIVLKSLDRLLNNSDSRRARRYAQRTSDDADALYIANWTAAWSLPQVVQNCGDSALCVDIDNTPTIEQYNANALELYKLVRKTIRKVRRLKPFMKNGRRTGRKLLRQAEQALRTSIAQSAEIPSQTQDCDGLGK